MKLVQWTYQDTVYKTQKIDQEKRRQCDEIKVIWFSIIIVYTPTKGREQLGKKKKKKKRDAVS
jgi:hypothetical protein